ncbi:MAG TPA: hypothetical protein PKA41_08395 [Verrucomicrobiota bacterium]|nr:hypothetical protein [Verrucomicrobiota bacterium]
MLRPAVPPAPVVTTFDLPLNGSMVDLFVEWTWDGQGWPDDGEFLVLISSDADATETVVGIVNGPGRSCALTEVFNVDDMNFYCRVQYRKGATYGDYSNVATRNPV